MALRKQRSGEAKEEQGLTNDSNQTQLDFDSQPTSYESSDSISEEQVDYSEAEKNLGSEENETVEDNSDSEQSEQPAKVVKPRKRAVIKVDRSNSEKKSKESAGLIQDIGRTGAGDTAMPLIEEVMQFLARHL